MGTGGDDPPEAVLARLWPGGLHDEDRALMDTLPADRRVMAFQRLAAVADVDDGLVSALGAARRLGISRSTFVAMWSKWSKRRRIASVLPYVGRKARGVVIGLHDSEELRIARGLVERHGSEPNAALIRRLMEASPAAMSRPTAAKVVQRVRSEGRTHPSVLRSGYGTHLLIDTCALSLLADAGREPTPYVAAFVVDRASTLLLAAELGTRETAVETQVRSVGVALDHLRGEGLDRRGADAELRVVLADGWPDPGRQEELLRAVPLVEVLGSPRRRSGEALTYLLGKRIGPVWLHPRSTRDGSEPPTIRSQRFGGPVPPFVARTELAGAVAGHNADLLPAIRAAGVADAPGGHGAMTRSLEALQRLWAPDS